MLSPHLRLWRILVFGDSGRALIAHWLETEGLGGALWDASCEDTLTRSHLTGSTRSARANGVESCERMRSLRQLCDRRFLDILVPQDPLPGFRRSKGDRGLGPRALAVPPFWASTLCCAHGRISIRESPFLKGPPSRQHSHVTRNVPHDTPLGLPSKVSAFIGGRISTQARGWTRCPPATHKG